MYQLFPVLSLTQNRPLSAGTFSCPLLDLVHDVLVYTLHIYVIHDSIHRLPLNVEIVHYICFQKQADSSGR